MTELVLAITDFAMPFDAESAPRLDALGRLLGRGDLSSAATPGWRHWVLERAGWRPPARLPLARTLAGGDGNWAIVTPVHLLAGLEHVHLDPAGLPLLTAPEWAEILHGLNELFAPDGMSLRVEGHCALLQFGEPLDVVTHDPQALAGCDAGVWLPSGNDGGKLRRVMTEMQMWLHEHPVNQARAGRGEQPVNGLWIWGLGGEALSPPERPPPGLSTHDAFLACLWRAVGADCRPTPRSLDDWLSTPTPAEIVTLALAAFDRDPAAALERIEERWFAPLESSLASGELTAACLFLGDTVATVRRSDRLRFWRQRRHWREALR